MKNPKSILVFCAAILAFAVSAFDVPLTGKTTVAPKGLKLERRDGRLIVKLPKTEKKTSFASVTFVLSKTEDFSKFTGVSYTVKSSQPVKTKCTFGTWKSAMTYKESWPKFVLEPGVEKTVEFAKDDFVPRANTTGSADSVKIVSLAFGLWNYDSTQEDLEIEIAKCEIRLPAENK